MSALSPIPYMSAESAMHAANACSPWSLGIVERQHPTGDTESICHGVLNANVSVGAVIFLLKLCGDVQFLGGRWVPNKLHVVCIGGLVPSSGYSAACVLTLTGQRSQVRCFQGCKMCVTGGAYGRQGGWDAVLVCTPERLHACIHLCDRTTYQRGCPMLGIHCQATATARPQRVYVLCVACGLAGVSTAADTALHCT
jgi:hypothetical protein